jgi:hypothetical protein
VPNQSLEIRFESERHSPIVEALMARRDFSKRYMDEYSDKWRDAEDRFVAYMPETEADAVRKDKRKDGFPKYTTVHVPQSYAQLMAAHTYWTSVFLGRNPVFQHQGRHGEGEVNVSAVDAIMDYQIQMGGHLVPFYIWLLDPGRYGFGVLWNYWTEETVQVSQIVERPVRTVRSSLRLETPPLERVKVVQRIPGYQGNKNFNVQPWDFMPDPRVPLCRMQEGEFVGRRIRLGWNTIKMREAQGIYFNVEELKKLIGDRRRRSGGFEDTSSTTAQSEGSPRIRRPALDDLGGVSSIPEMGFVDGFEMVVELSPRDWKVGESSYPEKWVFTVAEDEIIVGAQPLGAYHNKFPCNIIEYEPEGYGLLGESLLSRTDPINDVMNWLLNTHFYNVRQALTNQFVYDPSRMYEEDVLDTEPGKMMRLRPEAYGTDVRTALAQFPVQDVTRGNVQDLQLINEIMQRISGINDTLMGAINPGGRKTATEVRSSSSFGINRLKTAAEFFSAEGWHPLDQMMVQNTQQYYTQERKYRIAGDQINTGEPFVDVSPESIQGFYDFVPVDGTLPVDKLAMANLWRQLMVDMSAIPQIAAQYNLGGIFEFTAQMAGLKGVRQFKVQAVPDEQLAAMASEGNIVPIGGGGGVPEEPRVEAPEPRRIPDVGRTQ